jgi:glycosyltransferase involved in cell wall biosynthesis
MTTDTIGGVWTFAMDLCAGLAERGTEITLFSMGRLADQSQRAQANALENVRLVPTAYRLEWMQDCEADVIESGRLLRKLADEIRPDVVHINGYYHATLAYDAPVLLTAHSCVATWWRACRREPLPPEWDRYEDWVSSALRSADLVVAPTHAFLDDFQALHEPARSARVIRNGRDPSRFRAGAKSNVVLAAGRLWDEAKNIDVLRRAAANLDAEIEVAGDDVSPDGQLRDLNGLTILGRLGQDALAERMACAAVFASPARYEPFGLTILEAALSECALVLSDIATLRELWDGAAVFVDPDDVEGWREALARFTSSPAEAARAGRLARESALRYSAQRMADGYWEAYRSLLAASNAITEVAA